jgi:hypothetical protein
VTEIRTIAGVLDALRKRRGLTVPQLAADAGMPYRTLVKYLRGERRMEGGTATSLFLRLGWHETTVRRVASLVHSSIGFTDADMEELDKDRMSGQPLNPSGQEPDLSRTFRELAHQIEHEAHVMGASIEDMDYIRASLANPEVMENLLEDEGIGRPLTEKEQQEEMDDLRDELLAWLKRRIERRGKRRESTDE